MFFFNPLHASKIMELIPVIIFCIGNGISIQRRHQTVWELLTLKTITCNLHCNMSDAHSALSLMIHCLRYTLLFKARESEMFICGLRRYMHITHTLMEREENWNINQDQSGSFCKPQKSAHGITVPWTLSKQVMVSWKTQNKWCNVSKWGN